jgi:plasmid stability protein
MANLVVRNVDERIVRALKSRTGKSINSRSG